jgi:hypothetical protein
MLRRAQAWVERQKQMASRRPRIRLDSCTLEPLPKGTGYAVVIDGFNLYQAISPPLVTVGGERVEPVNFRRDGKQIRGLLRKKPDGEHVQVNYGFARAELHGVRFVGP